ncbi:LOW QUALITY PROTEIN: nestin [Peromyscus californicus insignis]|uniref:LOW QUALITY PROTEIN: nestin n=1 Tax=Peromyscus californicus insignis TaxID=564181 RepID=UPI0022A751A2|nr:LOW QUALITY PROTEIN: nestin [Peromyscus californicus insignis]
MEGCVGEESFQLWELNRRLEAYLTRVKTLEEQNQLLSAELGGLRAQSGDASWRARADDELAALRVLVDQRWREKHEAEVQRDNLAEELEGVAGRCQQLRLARERTSEEAACSRRALEAEQSAQGWLSSRAAELERELEALRAAHEEERAHLNAQAACAPRRLPAPPRGPPARAPEVEELARRLGEAWRGAVRDYQERVAHMESSLGQARERLGRAVRGAREGRLELQQLQAERDGLQERREALEQRLEGRWQDRLQATEKFQLAVEALEQEKRGLQSQIAQILEGGQQLAHLKMSLSLEVATYRTLLEAENSRLQTPGRSSQASLGFHDAKLKLHFLGIPEDQHLGSVLPVLSPTPLPSPLPSTLETPVTTFLKTQEFLQARTPTLASTPIPAMAEAPCPTKAEVRAQDAPLSLLQTQGGRQQGPEPLWAEATGSVSTGVLPELEEPGGKQPGRFPEDPTSSAPSLNPHHPVLEAKDGESSESRVSSIFQEDEGQIWELVEKEAAIEVKLESSLEQETQEDGLDMEEIQDSQGPLQKETLEALGEETLISLKIQSHETPGKENSSSLRSIDANLGTLKNPEKEKQTLLKSLEEKDVEAEKTLEKEVPELPKPLGKEDPRVEEQELMSPEGTLETVSFTGKENYEAVRSSDEENLESLTALEKESQHPLGCPEEEDQRVERLVEKECLESLRSLDEEDQETYKPLEKENQEPLKSVEEEDQRVERLIEKECLESLRSLDEEDQRTVKPLERENQESLRSFDENQETIVPLESENQKLLKSLEAEEEQRIVKPLEKVSQGSMGSLEKENVELLRSLEDNDQMTEGLLKEETQESLWFPEDRNQETQDPQRSLEEEDQRIMNHLEKDNQEFLGSLEEEEQVVKRSLGRENHEPLSCVEKKDWMTESLLDQGSQDSGKSLEDENHETFRALKKENPETLQPLEEQDQEIQRSLQQETQQALRSVGDDQMAARPPEKVGPEFDQEVVRALENQNQESLVSLEERSVEAVTSSETENIDPLKNATGDLETMSSIDTQESLWSAEVTRETTKPLENEIQEPLEYVDGNQKTLRPLEGETQELSSPGKWDLEAVESPEGMAEGRQQLEVEACLEMEEHQESLRSLEEVGQELPGSGNPQRWEDTVVVVENGAVEQDPPLGRTGVGSEDEAELPRTEGGKEDADEERERQLDVTGEAWSLGSSAPTEQRVPSEEGSRKGSAEALQDLERQPEQIGALEVPVAQGMPEATEPLLQEEDGAQAGGQDSVEATLGSEVATGAALGLEQDVVGLEEPRHLASGEAIHPSLGEESVEAKVAQDLEGPEKEPKEAGAVESEIFELPKTSDALESKGCQESEPVVGWGVEEASVGTSDHEGSDAPQPRPSETEEDEGTQATLAPPGPKLVEPCSSLPALEDACELQPQAEGIQEAGWQLEGVSEVLGKVEDEQEFGLGETPEGLQDWEDSREESEADVLGETLPDSTPLGLYLRSPTSPEWDLDGEQRLSPQGEARKEGWGPAVLASQGLSSPPGEEEQGRDSDLSSEEFEDLGTEASLLPGVPQEAADHLGQVPPVLDPECWGQGGESDGFADEEESGEEGEEGEHEGGAESGAQWWGPGPSGGGFKVQDATQRGDLLEHESVGVSGPWDDGLRGATANISVAALETESQDSAEPSGSEGSESVSSEGEDQVPGHLDAPQEVTSMVPGAGDTFGIGGQGPSLESEHVNGRMENGLEQSEEQGDVDGGQDQEHLLQEQEARTLKAPLVGSPVHLDPSQSLEFPRSGVDGDSWSSGED